MKTSNLCLLYIYYISVDGKILLAGQLIVLQYLKPILLLTELFN